MSSTIQPFTYASVCDGIGAVHQAWSQIGMEPAWSSEIDPYPAAVVEHHWGIPNLGDMTKINTKDADHDHGRINLLVGGTPCQSFSIAGLRKGLDDPRGNLSLVFLRLLDQLRPRWVVWENVPGVLSSGGGRDFGSFLGAMGKLGYGWSYRVLDAQFIRVESHPYAVPQRRRRVFVVGCLGDPWRAASVLFERESMRGDPAPRRQSGAGVARTLSASTGGSSAKEQQHTFIGADGEPLNPLGSSQPYKVANCMTRRMHKGINSTVDEGQTPVVFNVAPSWGDGTKLQASQTDTAPTLNATNEAQSTDRGARIVDGLMVRRLMPIECERLQGFPDNYTLIDFNGKPASDTRRHQALGNSMGVNVMRWIGERVKIADRL